MKFPWMKFVPGDWLKDPAVSLCSPAARGIWMDLICAMHEAGQSGQLRGTNDQLARLARCQPAELAQALTELQASGAAVVTQRNENVTGIVTVCNRRMQREEKAREQTRKRVSAFRRNAVVTPYARARASDLSLKSESRKEKEGLSPPLSDLSQEGAPLSTPATKRQSEKALAKLTEGQQAIADRLEVLLAEQWSNDAGKWVNRIKSHGGKCERVAAELKSAIFEARIKSTPAQYAEQIWKEFA
jgi:hypothetical protein